MYYTKHVVKTKLCFKLKSNTATHGVHFVIGKAIYQ